MSTDKSKGDQPETYPCPYCEIDSDGKHQPDCPLYAPYTITFVGGVDSTGDEGAAVPQGWQCPICGLVLAPWVSQCPNFHGSVATSASSDEFDI